MMACYPGVHEQALSPRQRAEQLSGFNTRAIQNYFRIPPSVCRDIKFRGSALPAKTFYSQFDRRLDRAPNLIVLLEMVISV